MELSLHRQNCYPDCTEGRLSIDGITFACDTIEPPFVRLRSKADKLPNGTAIPVGRYRVILAVSPRFKRVLPRLENVPFFDGILIHSGNTAEDSRGCILVGIKDRRAHVSTSRVTLVNLMSYLDKAQERGEPIYITITNPIRPA